MPHLARSQILTGYAALARSVGLPAERLIRSVGLDLAALDDLDARIPARAFAELLELSAEMAQMEDFGLRLAESRELGILGPIGIVVRQEPDLRSALLSLARYLPLHNESLELKLEENSGLAVLSLQVQSTSSTRRQQVIELSLGTFFRILCRLAGPYWKPHRICFEHGPPKSLAGHRRFFGCRVEFEHDFNAIIFRAGDLDTPLAMSDAMLSKYAHRYLDSIMHHRSGSTSEKIRELVRVLLSSGSCTADKVARRLGVDRRTVHRYLTEGGETFSSVLAEVRTETATRLLSGHRPLAEVANLAGFSGPAAFSRWFKQTFGCSPTEWREKATQRPRRGPSSAAQKRAPPRTD